MVVFGSLIIPFYFMYCCRFVYTNCVFVLFHTDILDAPALNDFRNWDFISSAMSGKIKFEDTKGVIKNRKSKKNNNTMAK